MKLAAIKSRGRVPFSASGFTLVEMLVVVAIIVVLLAITIPVLSFARRAATRMACQSQITALDSAIRYYYSDQTPNAYPPFWSLWWNSCDDSWPWDSQTPRGIAAVAGLPTQSENLVMSLLGGIIPSLPSAGTVTRSLSGPKFTFSHFTWSTQNPRCYDPFAVGKGPLTGPGATIPPLRQLDCYYKYKEDELQDFDGNGLYEFKDKSYLGMPILYYSYGYDIRNNGPKYFNGWDHNYYKINQDGSPYDPKKFPPSAPLVDDPARSYKHFLVNAQLIPNSERPFRMYVRSWTGSGTDIYGDFLGGILPNNGDYILFSAGPDGLFGPDPRETAKYPNIGVRASNDQKVVHQMIVDCDDVTSWNRK